MDSIILGDYETRIIIYGVIFFITMIIYICIICGSEETSRKRLINCMATIIFIVVAFIVPIVTEILRYQVVSNLVTNEERVTAQVIDKEESYTREGNTVTYNYCVTVQCQTEEGIFKETFNSIDLYENVKYGDTLEVILIIVYKKNGAIYDTSMYQISDE